MGEIEAASAWREQGWIRRSSRLEVIDEGPELSGTGSVSGSPGHPSQQSGSVLPVGPASSSSGRTGLRGSSVAVREQSRPRSRREVVSLQEQRRKGGRVGRGLGGEEDRASLKLHVGLPALAPPYAVRVAYGIAWGWIALCLYVVVTNGVALCAGASGPLALVGAWVAATAQDLLVLQLCGPLVVALLLRVVRN